METHEILLLSALLLICAVIYFCPTIVAFRRCHRNRWVIFLINLALGSTIIGWLFALIWAMNKIDDPI